MQKNRGLTWIIFPEYRVFEQTRIFDKNNKLLFKNIRSINCIFCGILTRWKVYLFCLRTIFLFRLRKGHFLLLFFSFTINFLLKSIILSFTKKRYRKLFFSKKSYFNFCRIKLHFATRWLIIPEVIPPHYCKNQSAFLKYPFQSRTHLKLKLVLQKLDISIIHIVVLHLLFSLWICSWYVQLSITFTINDNN